MSPLLWAPVPGVVAGAGAPPVGRAACWAAGGVPGVGGSSALAVPAPAGEEPAVWAPAGGLACAAAAVTARGADAVGSLDPAGAAGVGLEAAVGVPDCRVVAAGSGAVFAVAPGALTGLGIAGVQGVGTGVAGAPVAADVAALWAVAVVLPDVLPVLPAAPVASTGV